MNDRGRCGICCVCCGLFCWRVKRFTDGSNQNSKSVFKVETAAINCMHFFFKFEILMYFEMNI